MSRVPSQRTALSAIPPAEPAAKKVLIGGPIMAASVNAAGVPPGFSTQFCDVEVDPETGKVTILRLSPPRMDVGRA